VGGATVPREVFVTFWGSPTTYISKRLSWLNARTMSTGRPDRRIAGIAHTNDLGG
jgi:hypothetical protein